MGWVQPEQDQIVVELLDPGLVAHRGVGEVGAARTLGWILARRTVDVVQLLGLRVERLEVLVRERPGRREAAVVLQYPEVFGPQPEERRPVELRVPADVVVLLGRELVPVVVEPLLGAVQWYLARTKTAEVSQWSLSRRRYGPLSSSSIRFPDGASFQARVPPPAPLPMITTS